MQKIRLEPKKSMSQSLHLTGPLLTPETLRFPPKTSRPLSTPPLNSIALMARSSLLQANREIEEEFGPGKAGAPQKKKKR